MRRTTRGARQWATFTGMLLASLASTARAQVTVPKPAGPHTLTGLVVDSAGKPIRDATVYIAELERTAAVRVTGAFRFDSVPDGRYTVGARAVGYLGGTGKVLVDSLGGAALIEMQRIAFALPSMLTTAKRGGLSGVIADANYVALPGVIVKVMGSGAGAATTDASGEFYLPVRPGKYLVRLDREGFRRQLISVTVPADEGRRMSAWMVIGTEKANPVEGRNIFDFEQWMIRRRPVSSALFTREDLERMHVRDAREAYVRAFGGRLDYDDCALIDGGPVEAPMWTISQEDVELMAVNAPARARGGRTSINGMAAMTDKGNPARKSCTAVVWLRK